MINFIRRYLGVKIFLSYLVVILVGVVVLAIAVKFSAPSAFIRHMTDMDQMMSSMMGSNQMDSELFMNFQSAVSDALWIAVLAAMAAALIASLFFTRLVISPVQEMKNASQRIAEGNYRERVQVNPSHDGAGQVDELGQLASSFNRMADTLEQMESMRSQLIGDVAHELRTPLTTIAGYMEGLMDGVLPASEESYLVVYQEADRLKRLVDDLQELSRVEAGAYQLHPKPLAAASIMATIVKRLGFQFEEKGVSLETEIHPGLPTIYADEDRTVQVLSNLVGNALQYTPAGGSVWIKALLVKNEVKISIHDSGIGILPEQLPHLFTRFYRVDKSRARTSGGSGIGLTIARYLVEAQGGRLWAESQGQGKGSTFSFTLPVSPSKAPMITS
jgi:signal transduction histidine kinase